MVGPNQSTDTYVSRLHLVGVATLFVVTVGLGLAGWAFRPSSSGFTPVPSDLSLALTNAPAVLTFIETMAPSGDGGGVLTLSAQGLFGPMATGAWTLQILNFDGGHNCTPSRLAVPIHGGLGESSVRIPPQHFVKGEPFTGGVGVHSITNIAGSGPFYIRLCWASNGPVAQNGAYLNARFPPVYVGVPKDPQGMTRRLNLGASDASDYSIQSIQAPTSVTEGGWQWAPHLSLQLRESQPLNFTAVNTSETQHDTYDAFLSGIVFGVAGGALVAFIQELVAPFRSRKELRPPEPGG